MESYIDFLSENIIYQAQRWVAIWAAPGWGKVRKQMREEGGRLWLNPPAWPYTLRRYSQLLTYLATDRFELSGCQFFKLSYSHTQTQTAESNTSSILWLTVSETEDDNLWFLIGAPLDWSPPRCDLVVDMCSWEERRQELCCELIHHCLLCKLCTLLTGWSHNTWMHRLEDSSLVLLFWASFYILITVLLGESDILIVSMLF